MKLELTLAGNPWRKSRGTPRLRLACVLAAALIAAGACVYRIDIQQGNLLEEDVIEQVELGMTRSQVQFLLGTPMISDSFHQDRWDYTYYFRRGRSRDIDQRWLIVFFEEDEVVRIDRDPAVFPVGR